MSEPTEGDRPGFVGIRWLLTSVETRGRRSLAPAKLAARVWFGSDGEFLAWDGINTLSGEWRLDGARLWVDAATTLVGYIGDDPATVAVMESFGPVLLADPEDQDLRVEWSDDSLVLRGADHLLEFTAQPPDASP